MVLTLRSLISYESLGVSSPFDPKHKLVTSFAFSPLTLALIRLALAFYTLFVSVFMLVWEATVFHAAASYFSYFTTLSYVGICAYFWASAVQTLSYVQRRQKGYSLQHWPRLLQLLQVFLQSTFVTFPILVTIVYWSLLASSSTFRTTYNSWSNISRHAMNTLFALFEIFLTNIPPSPWTHLPWLVLILAAYLGVAYITYATQGFYAYSFLDPSTKHGFVAVYVLGTGIAECTIFSIVRYICMFRERRAIRENPPTPVAIEDDWEELERPSLAGKSSLA